MLSYYANILKSYSQKAALFMPVTCGRPNEAWAGQFLVGQEMLDNFLLDNFFR